MATQTKPTFSRIGFNALGSGISDTPYFVNLTQRLRSGAVVVIDEPKLASQLVGTGAIVIDRRTSMDGRRDEGNVWRDDSEWRAPSKYVDAIIRNSPDKRTVKYVLNEPNVGSVGEMLALSRWLAEVGALLVARGYRAVLGNFPPANERLDWADAGAYDPLIKVIAQHPTSLYYGGHAYTWGALPLGAGVTSWAEITPNNLTAMRPEKWASASQINPRATWHLFRTNWVTNIRAQAIGLQPIPTIITEFGWGKMSDIPRDFYQTMEAHYRPTAGNNGLDGGESLRNLYAAAYPQWTHAQAMAEQIKWAERLYPSNVVGLCIFAYGTFADYGQDYSGNREFHDRLVAYYGVNGKLPPITPPTPPVKPQTWKAAHAYPVSSWVSYINLRENAGMSSKAIGRVNRGARVLVNMDGDLPDANDKALSWAQVQIGSKVGYVCKNVIKFVYV